MGVSNFNTMIYNHCIQKIILSEHCRQHILLSIFYDIIPIKVIFLLLDISNKDSEINFSEKIAFGNVSVCKKLFRLC